MSKIFIRNPNAKNVAFRMQGETGLLINNGLEGAVSITDPNASVCLAPNLPLPEAKVSVTKAIDLEGNFVVQVGDKIIPFLFKAEDLGTYFTEDDPFNAGVAFINATKPVLITCAEGASYLSISPSFGDGPWTLSVGGEVMGTFNSDYGVKTWFENNPEYNISYDIISSGSGSGSGSGDAKGLFTNNGDVGYPIQLTSPDATLVQSYFNTHLNSTFNTQISEDGTGPIQINFCLKAYEALSPNGVDIIFTEMEQVDYEETVVNGLNLTITFPNGETMTGFLANGQPSDGRYPVDTIGIRATELGYTDFGIAFGSGSETMNGGEPIPENAYSLFIRTYEGNYNDWHIINPKLLGIADRWDGELVNYTKVADGNYKIRLGPWDGN